VNLRLHFPSKSSPPSGMYAGSTVELFSELDIAVDEETVTTSSQSGVVFWSLRPRRGCFFMSVDGLRKVILKKIHVPNVETAHNLLGLDFLRQHQVHMHPGEDGEFSLDILSNESDATAPTTFESVAKLFRDTSRKY
jgi:hypothetical protein